MKDTPTQFDRNDWSNDASQIPTDLGASFRASKSCQCLHRAKTLARTMNSISLVPMTWAMFSHASNLGLILLLSIVPLRADRVGNGNLPSGQRSPDLWFDINAFASPADFTFGNAGRNILTGPGETILDGSIRKEFNLLKEQKLEFRAEFFNMLNHPYFDQPDNSLDDGPGAFGTITSLSIPMRQVQFGLKYRF